MNSIEFIVLGDPVSQGSMKSFAFRRKNGRLGVNTVHQKTKEIISFRKEVSKVLEKYHDDYYTNNEEIGFIIQVIFYLYKPKTTKRKLPTKKGKKNYDLDKMQRALGDALTYDEKKNPKGLFNDDTAILKWIATKFYVSKECDKHENFTEGCKDCIKNHPRSEVKITKVLIETNFEKDTGFIEEPLLE